MIVFALRVPRIAMARGFTPRAPQGIFDKMKHEGVALR